MFNRATLDVAANLSEILTDRNLKLIPRPSTLLGELCSSINNTSPLCGNLPLIDLKSIKDYIEDQSKGCEVGEGRHKNYVVSEHDSYMDNYIDDMSKLVSNYLNFSRNVVNKEVHKLIDTTITAVSNYRHKEAEDFFEIEYYKLPDVFKTYTINEEISSYANSNKRGEPEYINLKAIKDEEGTTFIDRFLIGDSEEDLFISGWLNSLGGKAKHYLLEKIQEYNLQLSDALDYGLVNYLFYRNLANTCDLNTGDSSATLKRKASYARNYFGGFLYSTINDYRRHITQGRIIATNNRLTFSYFNESNVKLSIYEESFVKLVELGGNIETILGYIVTGDSSVSITISELISKATTYKSNWVKTRSLYMIHLNSKRLDIFKHTLRNCFEVSINKDNLTESELEFTKNSKFSTETLKLANEYIDNLTINEIDNLENIALELVARIRFRFSNAYDLLIRMKDLMESDKRLDPMEAALYSVVNYLTDYMIDQMVIMKS